MARRRVQRGKVIDGILLLDKPVGITSNGALQQAKRLFNARKAGHTGSLDPIATGLLPLCFGEATKLSQFLIDSDKRYVTSLRLGQRTNTGDSEGHVISQRPVTFSKGELEQALTKFRGDFEQVPPMFSALKHQGTPLYKLAREGIEIERKPRPVTVSELEVLRMEADTLELIVHCSRGFYVRTLADELGEILGCGAHIEQLRRTAVGDLHVDESVSLTTLAECPDGAARLQYLLPLEAGARVYPAVQLTTNAAFYLCRGQAVRAGGLPQSGYVRLYGGHAGFLGLGEVTDDGLVAPKRLFATAGH
ncbi:MAG TPA: tRNA pseudouridine(55) synthase TruB [Gammaproteobacteria bacterium]|nr:tRNA pseudouridine(55) synthase TruB [Gammaproteobacteria bacterium]